MRSALAIAILCLVLASPVLADKQNPPSVSLKLVKLEKTTSSNPQESLYQASFQFTNTGAELVRFNNNEVLLMDDQGNFHRVVRLRNRQVLLLNPGQSEVADRMFYQLPNTVKPKRAVLKVGSKVYGQTDL